MWVKKVLVMFRVLHMSVKIRPDLNLRVCIAIVLLYLVPKQSYIRRPHICEGVLA